MAEMPDPLERMILLQKMRITTVIRLTQENSMLLSMRQRVAGKEIEVMVAERDLEREEGHDGEPGVLQRARAEFDQLQLLLDRQERAVTTMEQTLKQIDGDIAALCQS